MRLCERERRNPVGDWRGVSGLGFGRGRELVGISWIASRSFAMTVARGVPAADTLHLVRTVVKTSREWPPRGRP